MLKKSKKDRKFNNAVKKKEIVLPLYFGYQIRIAIEKIKNLRDHIFGPFKSYQQYISAVFILIIIASTYFFINKYQEPTEAATFNFNQDTWKEGASTTAVAIHGTSDQTEWKKYQSADINIDFSMDGQVSIASTTESIIHTLTADFSNGSSTGVIIIGDEIKLDLP